ncbi:MAG: preprotein translocase subunit SecG [SAR202 cluster bacterium Io17-Chloro-G3]|nr:MAG: preprotein translocase subunit SecG [SAR202 cluster bacterium Io17-Chloro-G3]
METYLSLTVIVIAVALIGIILLQVRGQGAGLFGSAQTSFRTRRGVELILYRFTIFLAALFILISLISILAR